MGTDREKKSAGYWVGGVGAQSAYTVDNRAGSAGGWFIRPAAAVVQSRAQPRVVESVAGVCENRSAILCGLPVDRSPVSVLPVWIFLQYLRVGGCEGVSPAESFPAAELSVGNTVPCWLSRTADHAGEIDFSV